MNSVCNRAQSAVEEKWGMDYKSANPRDAASWEGRIANNCKSGPTLTAMQMVAMKEDLGFVEYFGILRNL